MDPHSLALLGNIRASPGGLDFAFGDSSSVGARRGSGWGSSAPSPPRMGKELHAPQA